MAYYVFDISNEIYKQFGEFFWHASIPYGVTLRALFVLPSMGASVGRHFTHVDLWRENNCPTTVCAFNRGVESKRERQVDVVLGTIEHGKLLRRIPMYKKALERLMNLVSRSDVVFVYTLDNFLFAWMAKVATKSDIKIVLFVLDIRKMFVGNSLVNHITQSFLLFAFERCEMILVSSRYYIEDYAKRYLREMPTRWLEIENKVNPGDITPVSNPHNLIYRDHGDQIVIGYYGVIRCPTSVQTLLELVNQGEGRYRVIMRGVFLDVEELVPAIEENPWISYEGLYHNPDDLSTIYNSCDIVWACYPFSADDSGNHQWAKTNRFYEACYFQKPLIASVGTRDSDYVERTGIGLSVDMGDPAVTLLALQQIDKHRIQQWQDSLFDIPASDYTYTNEFKRVFAELGLTANE